jgi:hypothetical protein
MLRMGDNIFNSMGVWQNPETWKLIFVKSVIKNPKQKSC